MRTVAKGAVIPSALPANLSTAQGSPSVAANEGKKPLRLGLIIGVGNNPDAAMAKVHDLGLPTCQVFVNEIEAELVSRLRQALDRYQIEATSGFCEAVRDPRRADALWIHPRKSQRSGLQGNRRSNA